MLKLSEARLNALQARIKPHFLFNSLNSIASLIGVDSNRAEEAITDFSGLMRKAFMHKEKNITIDKELDWVRQYLAIEKLRLASRLTYTICCEEQLENKKIPVLCLQPLVENAVLHGIAPLESGGLIEIKIYSKNNSIVIRVTNPYGIEVNKQSNGMALDNISERLKLQYGEKAKLIIIKSDNIFDVQIGLPL